ncbi:diacylglycerol kinase family protein [Aurantiacibacter sp. MUD61]|uniref:diacylglycerol kinase family protein n=1 Tax=Aurantiacibacter sp. MUD61 TaxID=3009083 RepID=UPI0022F06BD2|nr:diacylglycerol kinase family protein [Aurantiacibacter sp. MUD61]
MHKTIHLFDRLPQVDARQAAETELVRPPMRKEPLIGVIRNARSHRNNKGVASSDLPPGVIVATPEKRSELPAILTDFAEKHLDCIAIDGGDGTVRDILTCGAGIFGDSWPDLIILPNGKTNALGLDLGLPPGWSLDEAIAAVKQGKTVRRRPMVIAQRENPAAQVRGFIMGAGVFNRAIALGQRSHDLGAFNAAAVGVTAAWSVLQALFGRAGNPWRRGTYMKLRRADGTEIAHHGGLPADERFLLFASTLQNFPAGLDPFRGMEAPLRMAVLDNPRRGLLLRIGALMRGNATEATMRRGAHLVGDETLEVDIAESFILDGEAFPSGHYCLSAGTPLRFVVP